MTKNFTTFSYLTMLLCCIMASTTANAQNFANAAPAAVATHSGGGASASGYGPELYNNNVIPQPYTITGTFQWGWVTTNGWIEFTWPTPHDVFRCVFHKANRPMTTCQIQYWDGSAYVTIATYNGSAPDVDSIDFPVVTTTRLRLNGVAGSSNPNHREIQVMEVTTVDCDGAPEAGIVHASETITCPGYPIRLVDTTHQRDDDSVVGFTWVWEQSLDNVLWQDVAGSQMKDTLDVTGMGIDIHYRLKVICTKSMDTSYSNTIKIENGPSYACYCFSMADGGRLIDTTDNGGFTIGNFLVNDGGPHTMNPIATRPRTTRADLGVIELYQDSTYEFSLFHTMPTPIHADGKVTIFMDFNNNLQYDIPEERVYTGYTGISKFVLLDTIRVPKQVALNVPTGMRVIINNDLGPNAPSDSACGVYTSGETEDFVVIFRKNFPVAIGTISGVESFDIYPNPASDIFTVDMKGRSFDKVAIAVTNVTGQKVYMQNFEHTSTGFTQKINLTDQAKGIYFVEINADGEKMMQKLILK